jgi:serine/threonine protein phosphatase PrpC
MSVAGVGQATNEDHCVFAAPGAANAEEAAAGYLFAAIDGCSSGGNGRSAARETGTSLLEILDDPRRTELRPDLMLHRLQDANDRCHRFIEGQCAVTSVWIWEDPAGSGLVAAWAHVGDTRLYHRSRSGWKCLTRDHAKGRLLDRAIGQGPGLLVDTGEQRLRPGDRLALLSDGVWNSAPPAGVLSGEPFPTTAEATRQLVGTARLNGSRDDTTAVVITVRNIEAGPEPEH